STTACTISTAAPTTIHATKSHACPLTGPRLAHGGARALSRRAPVVSAATLSVLSVERPSVAATPKLYTRHAEARASCEAGSPRLACGSLCMFGTPAPPRAQLERRAKRA